MKKLLVVGLLFGNIAMASEEYYTFLPYAGMINYSGTTTKDKGSVTGIYFSDFQSPYKIELDVEHTSVSYKDSTPTLTQSDFTGLIHYYEGYNLDYKLGLHYISSTDTLSDSGKIIALGILYYKTLQYNYGVDVFYSSYSNLSTSPTLIQLSPRVGINFGDYKSDIGSFYMEAKIDYIRTLTKKTQNNLNSNYTSFETILNNYNGAFTTTASLWIGKRSFAVENGGFIVNNIGDEQTGGYKFSENYKIDLFQSVKAEFSYTKFDENGNSNSKTLLLNYTYSF